MKFDIRHGMTVAILILGVWVTAPSAQESLWEEAAGSSGFARVTPYPPAQCHPLMTGQPFQVPGPGLTPMPAGCFPIVAAPPLKRPEPSLFVGYLYKDRGAQIALNFSRGTEAVMRSTTCDVDLRGIWTECTLPIVLTYRADFTISVGHLFPLGSQAPQWYSMVDFPAASRRWNPDMRWWDVTAAWTYALTGRVKGVLGFRWSSLVVEFERPRNQRGFASSDDAAKLNANAYIPFVGLEWENRPSHAGCLKASVIGFPFLPGDFEHTESLSLEGQRVLTKFAPGGEYKTGYFLEASGEYAVHRGEWNFGAFARFTAMHVQRERNLNVNGILSETDMSYDRSYWIFGGKIGFCL